MPITLQPSPVLRKCLTPFLCNTAEDTKKLGRRKRVNRPDHSPGHIFDPNDDNWAFSHAEVVLIETATASHRVQMIDLQRSGTRVVSLKSNDMAAAMLKGDRAASDLMRCLYKRRLGLKRLADWVRTALKREGFISGKKLFDTA